MGASGPGDRVKKPKLDALRKRRYRARLREAKALGLALRDDRPPAGVLGLIDEQGGGTGIVGVTLLEGLERLANDEAAPGQARVSAARAVLEAQGVLGRHARDPADEAAERPVGLLSRAGLERELVRLRRSVMPASRPGK